MIGRGPDVEKIMFILHAAYMPLVCIATTGGILLTKSGADWYKGLPQHR